MSKIPYIFETPIPVFFRKNGWFNNDNTLKFVTWCFSRCSPIEKEVFHDNRILKMKPFQFIFGRYKCSEETNMSEREVRTQQSLLEKSGLLKKSPNKTPNRFTIYEWVLDHFLENKDQQKDQQTTNRRPQTRYINTESDLIDLIDLGKSDDDSEVLEFEHKKSGIIKSSLKNIVETLKNSGWLEKEINLAIDKMKKQNPLLNGKIEAYLHTILKNQKMEHKKCKLTSKNKKKEELPKDNGYFMGNDLSEAPLAQFARQAGLRKK